MNNQLFESEIRCDFFISQKRKKIWAVQLELIEEFQRVCTKYELAYFASNGTLLGAVRHGGYVPWDDDVDIVMPRKDYDKFIEIAKKEFNYPIKLQMSDDKGNYFKDYLRLANLSTTAITERDWDTDTEKGIFIDVFALDKRPDSEKKWRLQKKSINLIRDTLISDYYYKKYKPDFYRILHLIGILYNAVFGRKKLLALFESKRKKYSNSDTQKLFQITPGDKILEFSSEWFDDYKELPFEYLKIRVPKDYDKILRTHYGDYMSFPPPENRGVHHSIFFDPDKPYTEYMGRLSLEEAKMRMNDY